jgi:Na+-driven multidrug efflux pump
VLFAVANVFAMLLNGAQVMRFQVTTMVTMAILNIAISVFLASRIGVAGVALGSVFAVLFVLICPALIYVPRLMRRLERASSLAVAPIGQGERRGSES